MWKWCKQSDNCKSDSFMESRWSFVPWEARRSLAEGKTWVEVEAWAETGDGPGLQVGVMVGNETTRGRSLGSTLSGGVPPNVGHENFRRSSTGSSVNWASWGAGTAGQVLFYYRGELLAGGAGGGRRDGDEGHGICVERIAYLTLPVLTMHWNDPLSLEKCPSPGSISDKLNLDF